MVLYLPQWLPDTPSGTTMVKVSGATPEPHGDIIGAEEAWHHHPCPACSATHSPAFVNPFQGNNTQPVTQWGKGPCEGQTGSLILELLPKE